jgi:hypothetical protein
MVCELHITRDEEAVLMVVIQHSFRAASEIHTPEPYRARLCAH